MTNSFSYRTLFTHQLADALAESDATFNNLLTEVTDLDNIRHNNAKGPKGEVAAGGTYKKLILLDASNIVQLGEAGTEVRVPADPTNVLGVATKQYVDGVQMFQTQPRVSASSGVNDAYATLLNVTAAGHLRAITMTVDGSSGGNDIQSVRITIDGGTPVVYADAGSTAINETSALMPDLTFVDTNVGPALPAHAILLDIAFNTSILVETKTPDPNASVSVVVYDKIP